MEYFLDLHPDFGLVKALTLDDEGRMHINEELELVFNKPGGFKLVFFTLEDAKVKTIPTGSIRNCGKIATPAENSLCTEVVITKYRHCGRRECRGTPGYSAASRTRSYGRHFAL